jgi:hypothetical protein
MTTLHVGPRGQARSLDINPALDGAGTTVCWWLLTGPWHPLWPQFVLSVVSLRDVEGVPPAKLHFPGATHELLVLALNPDDGPTATVHTAQTLEQGGFRAVGGHLEPADVVHQFTATDEEMLQLADLLCRACVDGHLTPSTDDARDRLREAWLSTCVKTLAHMRGEAHAR